jgi:hypothetical protein
MNSTQSFPPALASVIFYFSLFFFSFYFLIFQNAIEDPSGDGNVLRIGAVSAHNQYFLFETFAVEIFAKMQ